MSQRDFDYNRGFTAGEAERDALRNEVGQVKGEYDRAVNKIDALQALLTAADERADRLEAGLKWEAERNALLLAELESSEELDRPDDVYALMSLEAGQRIELLEGALRDARQYYGVTLLTDPPQDAWKYHRISERIDAALKPSEVERNQCDGCQAGIPVVNGAHRMGKPGSYPDTMSCTAKLYKP